MVTILRLGTIAKCLFLLFVDSTTWSPHQQCLFLWHTKWGHLGWQHTPQWLGRCGLLGHLAIKMGSTNVLRPKCAACQRGKQEHTPKKAGSTHGKDADGVLKTNKLALDDLVFLDQYESPLLGHRFSARGNSKLLCSLSILVLPHSLMSK
jgi:hypothetical protein